MSVTFQKPLVVDSSTTPVGTEEAINATTHTNNPINASESAAKQVRVMGKSTNTSNLASNTYNTSSNSDNNNAGSINNGSAQFGKSGASSTSYTNMSTKTKKQLFMEQRAQRLKDPKVRHMGIDKEALDAQVREKEALKELEKSRDAFYDRQALMMDKHACLLQHDVNKIRMAREKELTDYRTTYQRREDRREWDLSDPNYKSKELPPRVGDNDPRTGVSGLQKFDGEDLDFTHRRRAQQEQQRAWATQQMEEKLVKRWMDEDANNAYDARNEETNHRIYCIEQKIADERKERDRAQAEFNKALSTQKEREAVERANDETLRGLQEIDYQMNSDFLTEKETVVNGELGASVKAERYKGLPENEKQKFYVQQREQLEQMRRRRLMDAEAETQWAQQENMQLRMAAALDRQRARERKADAKELALTQKQQASAAAQRKKELDALYTNAVDEDYYKYWDRCM